MATPFKMKGFSGFGNSPAKQKGILREGKQKVSEHTYATSKPKRKPRSKATKGKYGDVIDRVKDVAENVDKTKTYLTKKHKIYQGPKKKLTLHGQVDAPKVDAKWDGGKPSVKAKGSGRLEAKYDINKRISAHGGVDFKTGEKPGYRAGLRIKL